MRETVIKEYLSSGKSLTLLKGKRPCLDNWVEVKVSEEDLINHNDNLGWVLGPGDLVIDIDPKNGGNKSFKELLKELGSEAAKLAPTVMTPSGGCHIYLKMDNFEGKRFKKTLNKIYPGIDFLTAGSQCVIPGSKTEKGEYVWVDEFFGFVQGDTPLHIVDLISYEVANDSNLGDFEGLIGGSSSNWPVEKVLEMLQKLDPSMGNDTWVKVGMALHDWDPVEGLELWENWSKDGDNYEEGVTEKRWRSFGLGGGVTLGTISYMAREVDYQASASVIKNLLEKIRFADTTTLEFEIIPKIKKLDIDKLNRSKISKAIQNRYKAMDKLTISISDIKQSIAPALVTGHFVENNQRPDWCNKWIYINSHAGFMNLQSLKLHKAESFNVENGKYIPASENGQKVSASKYISDRGYIDKVDALIYMPTCSDRILSIEGSSVLNTFNQNTVPIAAKEYTEGGLKMVNAFKKHIRFVCGSDENADILMQWLAHQVQFPGKKILWSPVIQSIQGTGKTFFSESLALCLGDSNVGTVAPSQVTSDFNAWATGHSVVILEELRVKGHNRYEAVNALKPLITDRKIMINDKGIKPYQTINVTNYLCFTNYKDAIPLTEDDRRWWIIFIEINSLKELSEHLGEPVDTYYNKLFDLLYAHGNELRKFMLEYPITEKFKNIKQAPMTEHKQSMIATEELNFEGLSETRELIELGGKYYNKDVICSSDLFDALLFEHPELSIQGRQRHQILKHLGYTLVPSVMKIDGKTRKVWTKRRLTNEQIRDSLDDL